MNASDQEKTIVIIQQPSRKWIIWLLLICLGFSLLFNLGLFAAFGDYYSDLEPPTEKFHSGEVSAPDKIARLAIDFTIMPPYSERMIKAIDRVTEDESVKGVLMIIDSPGGLVSDSHQIYDKLRKLRETKPVHMAMKGIAASGGYYIAMGGTEGAPIYAEPSTWTGSIGVIIPRYNASELGGKIGVKADSLVTGPYKDTLNPLKDLTDKEREVWNVVLEDSFDKFLTVIDEGRPNLNKQQVRDLATGQIYTADQALANGLVDKIGYEEAALEDLKTALGLTEVRVISYSYPVTFAETLLGASAQVQESQLDPLTRLINSNVPRAMYMFGWHNGLNSNSL